MHISIYHYLGMQKKNKKFQMQHWEQQILTHDKCNGVKFNDSE